MEGIKYLRQLKTGTIYVYTDILAKRRDMVPYDANAAKARIESIKNMLENRDPDPVKAAVMTKEAAEIKADASELAGLEERLEKTVNAEQKAIEDAAFPEGGKALTGKTPITKTQSAENVRQDTLNKNPKYQKAAAFKSRNEVEQYMLLEFGKEIDITRPFKDLKEDAIGQTVKRILEA